MSQFCEQCGSPLNDSDRFCEKCGTPIAAPAAAPAAPKKKAAGSLINRFKTDKKFTIIVAAAAAVVILAVILICIFAGGGKGGASSWKDAVENIMSAGFQGEASKKELKALAPAAYWDYLEKEEDMDIDDAYDEYQDYWADFEESMEYMAEMLDEKKIKFDFEIGDKEKLSKSDRKDIAEELEDMYDIDSDSVTAGYEVEVEMFIKDYEDYYTDSMSMYVMEIDGGWYVLYGSDFAIADMF